MQESGNLFAALFVFKCFYKLDGRFAHFFDFFTLVADDLLYVVHWMVDSLALRVMFPHYQKKN